MSRYRHYTLCRTEIPGLGSGKITMYIGNPGNRWQHHGFCVTGSIPGRTRARWGGVGTWFRGRDAAKMFFGSLAGELRNALDRYERGICLDVVIGEDMKAGMVRVAMADRVTPGLEKGSAVTMAETAADMSDRLGVRILTVRAWYARENARPEPECCWLEEASARLLLATARAYAEAYGH